LVTNGLRFAGPGVEAWLDMLGRGSEFTFSQAGDSSLLRRAQRQIVDLVTRRPSGYEWYVHLLITQILGLLLRVRRLLSEPARPVPRAVVRVLSAVGADPCRNWRAGELAQVSRVSYSKLRNLFRQIQGETLKAFLIRSRLEQARRLLGDQGLSVKEVARHLNFSSEYYFSQFFRKHADMSPTEFRRLSLPPRRKAK
jgi:AraC-like DNA-binding protein